MLIKKDKYKAVFLIKKHNTHNIRKKKKFNPLKPIIKYKGKAYAPEIDVPTYSKGKISYFFFDVNGKQISITDGKDDNGKDKKIKVVKQLGIEKLDNDKEATVKDLLYIQEVIKQVFMSLGKVKFNITWLHLVLIGSLGLVVGWIIGTYIPISFSGG